MMATQLGVCAYAIPYSVGYVGRGTPRAHPKPLNGYDLLDLAQQLGLAGVELPLVLAVRPGVAQAGEIPPPDELDAFREAARARDLTVTVDTPPLDAMAMTHHLRGAARLGARVLRTMLSSVLCGDRRAIGGLEGWRKLMAQRAAILAEVAPLAQELDIRIGVENHQDATSDELVALCETVGSAHVGITLDTGNPLAVAEDPIRFAAAILPHLVHVHLKDYRVAATPSGYALYHCPIGSGVVDFRALFDLLRRKPEFVQGHIAMNLEMAMLGERHIRVLEDDYWAGFAPRPVDRVLPVLRLRAAAPDATTVAGPSGPWLTPWDTGDDAGLGDWELARLAESAELMRGATRGENQ